jgi:hypothetical protein
MVLFFARGIYSKEFTMELPVPPWVIVAIIVIIALYIIYRKKGAETFLTPSGIALKQADLVEIGMRRGMYA